MPTHRSPDPGKNKPQFPTSASGSFKGPKPSTPGILDCRNFRPKFTAYPQRTGRAKTIPLTRLSMMCIYTTCGINWT